MLSWKYPLAGLALVNALTAATAPVDYLRDVKPILKQYCYRCHGASQQKGGMRADTVAFLREGGDVGAAIKPGNSKESVMVQAILGTHDDIAQMPYKKPPLADAQVATIRAWIDAGALAPENEEPEKEIHWAFIAPMRPDLPDVARPEWSRNPDRSFHPGSTRKGKDCARRGGRSRDAASPGQSRPHGTATDTGRSVRVHR